MSKEIYISSTPHETRLAIVENDALAEIYYERENEYTLAGSIYNGKVTRVLPGMQSSFVDIGLDRDAFLYITDFMEEAGDAADFDSSGNGGEGRRSSRDGQPSMQRNARPAEAEPTDAEMFTQAVAGIERGRASGGGERSGNRQDGRGRRDRNVNSDGSPRRDRGERSSRGERSDQDRSQSRPAGETKTAELVPDASILREPVPAEDAADLGSGAPGADGSRRWRGRRGRRGNRGDATRADGRPESVASEPVAPGAESIETEEDLQQPGEIQVEILRTEPRNGSDRGDRGGRGRAERGGRTQAPRVPRGFAPSTSLYQVDGSADTEVSATSSDEAPAEEPMVLPGESLSKYRKSGDEGASMPTVTVAATPSDFVVSGWDGGAVLPGETIRPRGPQGGGEAASGTRASSPRRDERGPRDERSSRRGGREFSRGGRGDGRGDRARSEVPAFAASAETAWSAPEEKQNAPQSHAADETAAAVETVEAVRVNSTFVPPPPMPTHDQPAVEEEYEPVEASASYRVDPAAPSEYRQPAPVAEELHEAESPVTADHEITSIFASGEMHSEPLALTTQEATAPSETLPVAVEPALAEVAAADQTLPYFAPGAGVLEEEMLDEDEDAAGAPIQTLHAGVAYERYESQEQEMLEGGTDLGTMIREMSIDQITRSEPAVDEDDDLEEDFLEEDQEFEVEELGAEDERGLDDTGGGRDQYEPIGDSAETLENSGYGSSFGEEGGAPEELSTGAARVTEPHQDERSREDRSRDDRGRRDGRRSDRGRRPADRDRSSDRNGSDRGRRDGGRGRQSMQATNLPAISDLLKPGQEVLVQIAKEPIAKKGARITSHIALPGRFLVFMPTVQHTGVSRKIESDAERRRLKEILLSERGEAAGGFIVRTAAANASEEELRSDLRFLLNLWSDIKTRSEASKSPALIYHDLNLVERVLRDQVTDTFSAIWVDTESEYERVLRFLQRFQPSLIRRVKLYTKETPLFEQFGITEEINKALRSKVWLKSGGSIVINQTEALVAIDINTGKFVGKTARLEDTIVKTNLDAIPEIVRQIRLRDLGGIIIIDFIDMDERKNRNRVMAALEDELKSDRAPSKVLQFNDFGLVAITRKRVKQSLERTLSTTCGVCQGTGMTKSPITVCNDIYIELRKMHKHLDRGDIMLRVHPDVVKQLKSTPSRWLQEMEDMVGKTILVKSDPSLHPEQFDLH